jgi:hypothetical protein
MVRVEGGRTRIPPRTVRLAIVLCTLAFTIATCGILYFVWTYEPKPQGFQKRVETRVKIAEDELKPTVRQLPNFQSALDQLERPLRYIEMPPPETKPETPKETVVESKPIPPPPRFSGELVATVVEQESKKSSAFVRVANRDIRVLTIGQTIEQAATEFVLTEVTRNRVTFTVNGSNVNLVMKRK